MRGTLKILGSLAGALALASCTQTGVASEPTTQAPSMADNETVQRIHPTHRSYSIADVTTLSDEFAHRAAAFIRTCMSSKGYGELQQAAALTTRHEQLGTRSVLVTDPLEAGPYTADEATRFGMIGTASHFRGDEPGYVRSVSGEYDNALDQCGRDFDARHGVDSTKLISRSSNLQNTMKKDFLQRFSSAVGPLLDERVQCVRQRGYAGLVADPSASMQNMLASVGIKPGAYQAEPVAAAPAPLHDGVTVTPPDPVIDYTPTAAEVAFAAQYVQCGEEEDFVARWGALQMAPRAEVSTAYQDQVSALGRDLQRAVTS